MKYTIKFVFVNKRLTYDSVMHNSNPGTFILLWWYGDTILIHIFKKLTHCQISKETLRDCYKSLKRFLISFEIWLLHDHIKQNVINSKRTFSKSVKYFVCSGFPIMELRLIIKQSGELNVWQTRELTTSSILIIQQFISQ